MINKTLFARLICLYPANIFIDFSLMLIDVSHDIISAYVAWNDDYANIIPANNLFCSKSPPIVTVIEKQLNYNIRLRLYGNAHKAAADDEPRIPGFCLPGGFIHHRQTTPVPARLYPQPDIDRQPGCQSAMRYTNKTGGYDLDNPGFSSSPH